MKMKYEMKNEIKGEIDSDHQSVMIWIKTR